ncbi:MAG: hypothetical protein WDM76_04470 [Limisphaerales bacterium]
MVNLIPFLGAQKINGQSLPAYRSELNIVYAKVDGRELKLNAFLPANNTNAPIPAIVEIHGGWWFGGEAASQPQGVGGWQVHAAWIGDIFHPISLGRIRRLSTKYSRLS